MALRHVSPLSHEYWEALVADLKKALPPGTQRPSKTP